MTIHIAIGNTDDKLTQVQWSAFWHEVDQAVTNATTEIHGRWTSLPNAPYQNACWAFVIPTIRAQIDLVDRLQRLAQIYNQDSIAWNESDPFFVKPSKE